LNSSRWNAEQLSKSFSIALKSLRLRTRAKTQKAETAKASFGAVLIASAIHDLGNKIAHAINAKDKK
jgi:hypothetical protein